MSKLAEKVKEYVVEIIENPDNEGLFMKRVNNIQRNRRYRIKDIDYAIGVFKDEELNFYQTENLKGRVIDEEKIKQFKIAKDLLEEAKKIRRENNMKNTVTVETNILASSPFFVGGSRALRKKGKEKGFISLDKSGLLEVRYENNLGKLLSQSDARTLVALFDIWSEQGNDEWFEFTLYQLLEKTNSGIGGNQYKMALESLEKLRHTSIVIKEAFDIEKGMRVETGRFDLIIGDKTIEEFDDQNNLQFRKHSLQFSPFVRKSFELGYISLVSLALWDELEKDSSKAIYSMMTAIVGMEGNDEYLDEENRFTIPVDVVYDHLKLDNPKPSRRKAVVDDACEELKQIDVIEDYYYVSSGRKLKRIVIEPSEWLKRVFEKTEQTRSKMIGNEQLSINQLLEDDEDLIELE